MTDISDTAAALIISGGAPLDEVERTLREEAARLLEATAEDIQVWVARISSLMVLASASGNQDAIQSLHRQIKLLAEIQRVRASDAAWRSFMAVAGAVVSMAVRTTVGLLASGAVKLRETD